MSEHAPELRVQFTKRADGSVVLRCVRNDGSATWQRHEKQPLFFSFHDLSHFAVETTLGFRQGFYGLLADGWDIADTGGKGVRGKLPSEAVLVEHVVGLLDRERVGGAVPLSASDFNKQVDLMLSGGPIHTSRTFSDAELTAVRARINALYRDWAGVPPGGALELSFDRTPVLICVAPPEGLEARSLIWQLDEDLLRRYPGIPADAIHGLTARDLADRNFTFLVARVEGKAAGCGALRTLAPHMGEVKRMFVLPEFRRRGIARRILESLESKARELGHVALRLETGVEQPEAISLYKSAGYCEIEGFGEYAGNPNSLCFEKRF